MDPTKQVHCYTEVGILLKLSEFLVFYNGERALERQLTRLWLNSRETHLRSGQLMFAATHASIHLA
jgi:hypothetical protein